jgi:hypothetical protein
MHISSSALTARVPGPPLRFLARRTQAEAILAEGKADAIFMARELLRERVICAGARSSARAFFGAPLLTPAPPPCPRRPYFPLKAAKALGFDLGAAYPKQYQRGRV